MNNDKMECLPIHQNKCAQTFNGFLLSFGHNVISYSTTEKTLRFYITDDMRIDTHVQEICRIAYIDIQRISSIRHLLSIDTKKTIVRAFVLPKLDYCISLFYGSPMYMLERLQKVQNSAARPILQCCKQNHISPLLISLHWLPIKVHIDYKHSVICHSLFSGVSPI